MPFSPTPARATCHTHAFVLDVIILIFGEKYKKLLIV
jgi:hypothetical protein